MGSRLRGVLFVVLGLVAVAAPAARAQDSAAGPDSAAITHAAPAPHFDRIQEVRDEFTPENRRYAATRTMLRFASPFYGMAVALLLLFSGLSARMRDFAYARAKRRYPRVLIYVGLYLIVASVLEFPLAWFSGFFLEHRYQLSNQSFPAWMGEMGTDLAVSFVMLGVTGLIALAYHAIQKYPRGWWWRIGLGLVPVTLFMILIQPVFIDPLYNKFEPLENKALETKILALAAKADIPSRHVFQVDRSKQTKKFNAYVTGFGASQRIVLWDTTLQGMDDDEILFVMGHEMGHYKLGHMWKGMAMFSVLGLVLLFLCARIAHWAMRRFGRRWGFTELHDLASMPLFALVLLLLMFFAQPIRAGYTRTVEHESDVFGLEVTHLNDAAARAFIKLGSQNRADPEPSAFVEFWHYSHPPLIERVRFALEYRPWEMGEPNRAYKGDD